MRYDELREGDIENRLVVIYKVDEIEMVRDSLCKVSNKWRYIKEGELNKCVRGRFDFIDDSRDDIIKDVMCIIIGGELYISLYEYYDRIND